ncbi:alcohol dehydrogenase catalytic domain-containing protein [uncultured Victivallis sp.]|uniref:alcohol dehydrogenase catalytic domain-containing protein n=1 Tax=uncultured Victivallis sp. TaxID=354118 RepID=UPI0025CEEF25|nr:alcohol dehydrogenase catalytic domain-containing protein [uncultured Victivallis sp.]
MRKKHWLILAALFFAGVVLLAAGAGEGNSGTVFSSADAAAAAVGDDDLQIEVLHTRFCHDATRHGDGRCVQEIIGKVVSAGKNANGFQIGESVGLSCMATPCGKCSDCREKRPELCRYAGWACETGCRQQTGECRNRLVVPQKCVVRISGDENQETALRSLCRPRSSCLFLHCGAEDAAGLPRGHHHRSHHCR